MQRGCNMSHPSDAEVREASLAAVSFAPVADGSGRALRRPKFRLGLVEYGVQ